MTKEEFKLVNIGDRVKTHAPHWAVSLYGTVIGKTFSKLQVQFDTGIKAVKSYYTMVVLKEGEVGYEPRIKS